MNDVPKIKSPPAGIESESKTPVQFLPSTMLSWRAPIIVRRNPAELLPETPRDACGAARRRHPALPVDLAGQSNIRSNGII